MTDDIARPDLLEQLENRRMLSATLYHGTLFVDGESGNDRISVGQSGGSIVANVNGEKQSFAASAVKRLRVRGMEGNDRIAIKSTFAMPVTLMGNSGATRSMPTTATAMT